MNLHYVEAAGLPAPPGAAMEGSGCRKVAACPIPAECVPLVQDYRSEKTSQFAD
jgi:hypothetical protein